MILIVNPFLLRNDFKGITLWPFVIVKDELCKTDPVILNHERIHLRQQVEMLVLPFYIWYGLEYTFRLIQYKNRFLAYRNISFEREAYTNENDLDYVKQRSFWKFLKFF